MLLLDLTVDSGIHLSTAIVVGRLGLSLLVLVIECFWQACIVTRLSVATVLRAGVADLELLQTAALRRALGHDDVVADVGLSQTSAAAAGTVGHDGGGGRLVLMKF